MRRFIQNSAVIIAVASLLLAPSTGFAQGKVAKQAEKFRDQGAAARKAVEQARDQLKVTIDAYNKVIQSGDEKKLKGNHKKLASALDKMEKTVEGGRKQVQTFKTTAEKFFSMWEAELDGISTASIKQASESRLKAAKSVFQNMADNLSEASDVYNPMMTSLKEQSALVSQDLSLTTTEMLKEGAADEVNQQAEEVFKSIEMSLSEEQTSHDEMDAILAEEDAEADPEVEETTKD